jgi:ABC-type Fe3+ transport system substrate-binding protein
VARCLLGTALLAWHTSPAAEQAPQGGKTPAAPRLLRIATNLDVAKVERVLAQSGDKSRPTTIEMEAVDARELTARLGDKARPIDAVILEGVGYLEEAFSAGTIARFESAAMHQSIPYALRSRARGWFAVSYVARGVVSSADAKMPDTLANVWSAPLTGRAVVPCLPPAAQLRSRAALADAVRDLGPRAESVVGQWVAGAKAFAPRSELDVIHSVAAGRCTVGMAYSDVMAEAKAATPRLRFNVSWPRGRGEGASILATGIAMTTRHENYDRVLRLLEWMASDEGQRAWTAGTLSFPASQFVRAPEPVLALGAFPVDLNSLKTPPALLREAEKLSARVGYR